MKRPAKVSPLSKTLSKNPDIGSLPNTPQSPNSNLDKISDKKRAVIQSLANSATISAACAAAGITREAYYQWLAKDKDFIKRVESLRRRQIQVVEDVLYDKCLEGNITAIFFYLCNRDRKKWVSINKVESKMDPETTKKVDTLLDHLASVMRKGSKK